MAHGGRGRADARGVVDAGRWHELEDSLGAGELVRSSFKWTGSGGARVARAAGVPLVINARTDAFAARGLAGDARIVEAVRRANATWRRATVVVPSSAIARRSPPGAGDPRAAERAREAGIPPLAELDAWDARVSVGSAIALAAYGRARRSAVDYWGAGRTRRWRTPSRTPRCNSFWPGLKRGDTNPGIAFLTRIRSMSSPALRRPWKRPPGRLHVRESQLRFWAVFGTLATPSDRAVLSKYCVCGRIGIPAQRDSGEIRVPIWQRER